MFEQIEKPQIVVSVRSFVEFLLRSGNIDNRIKSSGSDVETMQEGARIHRLIQHRMGIEYHAEVPLFYVREFDDYSIKVEGRADGIIEGNPLTVDEIKTTHRDLIKVTSADPVHLAQAKCYAYFILKELEELGTADMQAENSAVSHADDMNDDDGLITVTNADIEVSGERSFSEISVRMTYCNAETLECKYFHETYTASELESFFEDLILQYKKWADFEFEWPVKRNESIGNIRFPFEYREGQKELIGQVYHTVTSGNRLFVEAPTGTGKTIATLYPSIKAMGEGRSQKIFYLTAKTITRTAACDCIDLLRGGGLSLKSVVLTAKEKICACENPLKCNPDDCPYAKGHMDRINDAVYDLLIHEDSFTRESVMEYADRHMVCPFEMSLDMSLFSDVVICDYNYVFDPNVYLRRFFQDSAQRNYIFLVDEAHNLVERAMGMFSAELVKEQFLSVKNMVRPFDARLSKSLETCNKRLLELKKECEKCEVLDDITPFVIALLKCQGNMERFLDEDEKCPDRESVLDLYFEIRHFLNMYENMTDEDYLIYDRVNENNDFVLKLLCTNPARSLRTSLDKGLSTVFFSATLLPIQYFKDMLTGEEDSAVYAKSVFDPAKRGLFIARDVSSKYTRRNETEYYNIASYIDMTVRSHPGNYIVFFPSYSFLQKVLEPYEQYFCNEDIFLMTQNPRMSEEERERFLKCFSDGITDIEFESLVGFCVMGGIFSEGIDLKGDNLIGSVIIGTGLPMVSDEREILKRKYDEEGYNGFDYAYRYPGMNKVLQAAGRVIRTEEDTGVVMLLDERFLQQSYIKLFPREWNNARQVSVNNARAEITRFWDSIT